MCVKGKECGVWSVKGTYSVECREYNVKCKVRSARCKVGGVVCGV